MKRTMEFSQLVVGDRFQTVDTSDAMTYVKLSARRARLVEASTVGGGYEPFAIKPSDRVIVTLPDPTPEEVEARRREWFEHELEYRQGTATRNIETFKERLDRDPGNAFRWATDSVEASAMLAVVKIMRRMYLGYELNADGERINELADTVTPGIALAVKVASDEMLRAACYPSRSTSPMSNLYDESQLKAYATFVEKFGRTNQEEV